MPFTLVGWSESQDTGGVLTEVAALKDDHIRYEGDNIVVPSLNFLLGAMAVGAGLTNARLASPSMRSIAELSVFPLNRAAEPLSPPSFVDIFDRPIELVTGEQLTAKVAEDTAGAEQDTVLAWLGDGAIEPVTARYITVKATGSTTLTAYEWTAVPLTFEQTLPKGRYQIIGMIAKSDGCIAARLVVPGFPWRPGVPGIDAYTDIPADRFRAGRAGVLAEFDSTSPPQVEFLSASADTAEEVWFDLVKIE